MFEGLEKRINKNGNISYWDGDTMVGKRCSKCGKDKKKEAFRIKSKKEDTYRAECKECEKQYREASKEHHKEYNKQYYKDNAERIKEQQKQYYKDNAEYFKQYYKENIAHIKEKNKRYRKNNKEYLKNYQKQYNENNKECLKEKRRQYRKENAETIREKKRQYQKEHIENIKKYLKEYSKQYYQSNKEYIKQHEKQKYKIRKESNLKGILNLLEQVNPLFEQLNLPIYGTVYKFENIKTNRCYIGQTILPLKDRYGGSIVKKWIEERLNKDNQKFKEELIEEDIEVTEVLDIAFCEYHLDKLEAHYINKYNSYNNGYNNNAGNYKTDDGVEEFENILNKYGLEYINGELRRIV